MPGKKINVVFTQILSLTSQVKSHPAEDIGVTKN
jgi:hypothetical protein